MVKTGSNSYEKIKKLLIFRLVKDKLTFYQGLNKM